MVGKKANPGARAGAAGDLENVHADELNGSQNNTPPFDPQQWRWGGAPSGHFPGRRHLVLSGDADGYWLFEYPGGIPHFAGRTKAEARRFALEKQAQTGLPILAEDSI